MVIGGRYVNKAMHRNIPGEDIVNLVHKDFSVILSEAFFVSHVLVDSFRTHRARLSVCFVRLAPTPPRTGPQTVPHVF